MFLYSRTVFYVWQNLCTFIPLVMFQDSKTKFDLMLNSSNVKFCVSSSIGTAEARPLDQYLATTRSVSRLRDFLPAAKTHWPRSGSSDPDFGISHTTVSTSNAYSI